MSLSILLADDHGIFRHALRALLEREGFRVVGEASDGHEAVRLAGDLHPDVAILDLAMPNLNGIGAARTVLQVSPETRTILLSMHTEDHYILEALKVGIAGYVDKTQAAADLLQAIQAVVQGKVYMSPSVSRAVVQAYLAKTDLPPDPLSPREREVLQLIAEGKTTKDIAQVLGVSIKTVESHRTHILEKLNLHETASLTRYAIRQGLIQP